MNQNGGIDINRDRVLISPQGVESLATVEPVTADQLPQYADVIRRSFKTVADQMGLTRENCLSHTSFISDEQLASRIKESYYPYGLFLGSELVGFVSLTEQGSGVYEMNHLSVLPQYQHAGYGRMLLDSCKTKVRELEGKKIIIGIVEEQTVLKNWYASHGFESTGTKRYEHLPFTVGFLEWEDKTAGTT